MFGQHCCCHNSINCTYGGPKEEFTPTKVSVEFVGEAQDDDAVVKKVLKGDIQLVYISPESILNNKRYRDMLHKSSYQQRLVAIVVDEAHCV